MNEALLNLEPKKIWFYFKEILNIPRPSKKEGKIIDYLVQFGKEHGLETLKDEVGNVLIRKPATPGMENRKTVVLQSHIDMVCEKNSDVDHDFENDPIEAYIEDGWVKAKGTTLGGDDGIGVAAELAILASDDIQHGPLECLFTVDEETGLTGAFGLKPGFLKGEILLNLDSEDEGQLFIGCAGGQDTLAWLPYQKETVPAGHEALKIMVSGLKGGHSGDDINKGRANANQLLNRFLWTFKDQFDMKLSVFDGGNLRNAIAREAYAVVTVPKGNAAKITEEVKKQEAVYRNEYHATEPNLRFQTSAAEMPENVIGDDNFTTLVNALYACPHGVIAMSQDIPNFVETSTNLASVKFEEKEIVITTSQRSSVESEKQDVTNKVVSVFNLAGARSETSDGYPGWTPNPDSKIMELTRDTYKKLFHVEPKVLAIHAGLECGLIGAKYPGMDMISFGPTLRGVHSPDEKLEIASVEKFWKLILEVLKNIPEKDQ
ncbi:aminoacyl-histidine dipeptidase [Candidatus Sulfidibacterium hydrothermale]|uniref:aminoacyl-histidine dipeptidase n=1 Tax=Candidatus Sulfidibacterium hydrothermale TaxID=2875962 RepID=UPI001F0AAA3D|nr:aminoacyl-histidine dipeptidase [Candidatus Sulfidibacterium hydrothermale]UBM61067.1 aminoacyl-histidine dipeptidase [Candidatus Sulfidibacterium hydrothermale]